MLFKKKLSVVSAVNKVKEERKLPMMIDKDSKFVYTGGSDVMKTFKQYGFVPPSEYRNDYLFKLNREASKGE
jgi:hypothetical protein